jgi:Dimerisation domain
MPPPFALYRMITGFYVARAIYVMARLGIADFLSDGPLDAEELAQRSKTHAPSLKRVLRLLVTAGVFTENNEGRFTLTPIGDYLRAGVPGSMRAAALLFGGITQQAWGDLLYSVETASRPSAGSSAETRSRTWQSTRRRLPTSTPRWEISPPRSPPRSRGPMISQDFVAWSMWAAVMAPCAEILGGHPGLQGTSCGHHRCRCPGA